MFIATLNFRHVSSWHQRYMVDKMYELLAFQGPLGESENYKWDKYYRRGTRCEGHKSFPGVTSHSPPKTVCVWLEDKGHVMSLVSHAGLYPTRIGKMLQAFKQEGHTSEFMVHKDDYRERTCFCALVGNRRGAKKRARIQVMRGKENQMSPRFLTLLTGIKVVS